ncbi:M23 family metallopeptidase [Croceicoccus hydrothermalis]|uniref:M23 family metallopeptidase n=1 Tax=Croceicoccus hydrothermalis TaxID=2867964 RepID=UPI001EFB4F96|nr:M23 family metallopeptidase [Croceicoccus hydrothermalis]
MTARTLSRVAGAAAMAGMIAACAVVPESEPGDAAARAPEVSATPVPLPRPIDVTYPEQQALPPARFAYDGEMTQGGWIRGTAPVGTDTLELNGVGVPMGEDGSFLAAFDRDAGPVATLVAKRSDGSTASEAIAISPRDWRIERVNIARSSGGPSAAFMRIRRPELERIGTARARDTGSTGWRQDFIWPAKGRISGVFGSQRIYRGEPGSYHSGIDIAPGAGVPFVAPADGTVVLAAPEGFSLEGQLLILDHGHGLNSAFLHAQRLDVKEGDIVRQGQQLGTIGSSGRATGPHLHWSMKWKDARLDPILFTGPMTGG